MDELRDCTIVLITCYGRTTGDGHGLGSFTGYHILITPQSLKHDSFIGYHISKTPESMDNVFFFLETVVVTEK